MNKPSNEQLEELKDAISFMGLADGRLIHESGEIKITDLRAMATELLELRERTNGVCNWKMDYEGNYQTDCDQMFFFVDDAGTATENQVKFCGYCGRPLVDIPYVEPEDE